MEAADDAAAAAVSSDAAASEDIAAVKIDVSKVAAAAGGGEYDEEDDPLNAPEVLAAVAAFRRKNTERDAGLRQRRMEREEVSSFLVPLSKILYYYCGLGYTL